MKKAVPGIALHAGAPSWTALQAPPLWRNVDVISDLHLQAGQIATFRVWQEFMRTTPANALFVLGDLFEVWVGDDVVNNDTESVPGFEAACAQVLKSASERLDIFFMHGNRDFLLGPDFAARCGMTLLGDPCALEFGGQRWLLTHGDAWCLDDVDYMRFRALVRSSHWQQDFLKKPLPERLAIARGIREQSEARKQSGANYIDVDAITAGNWLNAVQASTLIHGHTHRPADHQLGNGLQRLVLSDWDATAKPPRAQVLRLTAPATPAQKNCSIERLAVA